MHRDNNHLHNSPKIREFYISDCFFFILTLSPAVITSTRLRIFTALEISPRIVDSLLLTSQ